MIMRLSSICRLLSSVDGSIKFTVIDKSVSCSMTVVLAVFVTA